MDPSFSAPGSSESDFHNPYAAQEAEEQQMFSLWNILKNLVLFARMHIINILLLLPFAVMIWWKTVIRSQASGILSTKDASQAPQTKVTLASLTRKALSVPVTLIQNARDLGVYYVTFVMGAPLVITSDPDIARVIFTDKLKCHRRAYNTVTAGVLLQDDDAQSRVHKILAAALSDPQAIQSLLAVLQKRLRSETLPELEEACKLGERVDLVPIFEELVADSFAIWMLWDDKNESKTELELLVDARRTLADLKFVLPTGAIWFFDTIRDRIPLMEYMAFLPGCKDYYIRTNQKRRARKLVNDLILAAKTKRDEGRSNAKGGNNFFNRLMDISSAETQALTIEEIVENLEVIQRLAETRLFAAIPNLLYLLSHDKPTQAKIQAEVIRLNRHASEPIARFEDLTNRNFLATLDIAVKESLRFLPPMPVTFNRCATKTAYKLPGKWMLPEGYHIAVDLLSLQRSTAVFGEDAETFRPERFRPEAGVDVADSELFGSSYKPFGGGRFACPGQRIAMAVVKVIAAEVLRRYEIAPVDDAPEGLEGYKCSQGGSLRNIAGSPVILKKRK